MRALLLILIRVSEPFIESVPQVHLLFVLWTHSKRPNAAIEVTDFWYVTFLLSIAAASFGISKFIKAGPAGFMRNDKWLDGFVTWTFILLFLNVAFTLMAKGFTMAFFVTRHEYLLIFFAIFPQCLHVSRIGLFLVHWEYQAILTGFRYSLLLIWHQEGHEHNNRPPWPNFDASLQLLDIWPSEG